MSRLTKSFALLLSFAGLLLGATNANALACTSAATGLWSVAATWAAPCNIAGGPVAADNVTIAAAHTVTVDVSSAATSVAIAAPSVAAHGVDINPGIALNVSGAITMTAPAVNGRTSTLAVGSGTLAAGSILINGGGTATRISQVTVSTGTVTVTGAVTSGGTAAQSRFISTGASTVTIGGNFGPGAFTPGASTVTVSGNFAPATMAVGGTGSVIFTGGAAQSMGAFTTYNNVTVSKTAGAVSLLGTTTIGGALSVNTGTLTVGAFTLAVTGVTTVNSAISIISTTGTKTFTGNVTINSGGTLSETVAELITYGGNVTINNGGTLTEFGAATMACAGNFQNDGTYTASTGVHTFSGAAKIFGGVNPIVIPSATVSGTYQNNGTLTVATTLAGAGTLTNTGTLNIGAATVTPTLTATAAGNTVNYTRAGIQTAKATAYHHLGLSGTSAKTMTGVTIIGGDLNVSGSATMTNNAAFTVTGALNYSSTGATTLTAATPISIGSFNQTAGTLAAGANTITVTGTGAGAWTKTGTFTTTGTVIFTGAAPQIGASNFNNLTINTGAGAATLAGNATVAGNLAVSTGTLDLATFTANRTAAGGTFTVANGATLKIGGTNGFPANYTAHSLGVTSTVEYSGTDQSVGAEIAPGYGNLTISGSGVKTAAGNVTVGGTLTLTAGTFAVGANTLTLNGPSIAGTPANLSTTALSSLSFGGAASGVNMPGSVLLLNNLTVNNANGVILNSGPTVSGTLALTAGVVAAGSHTLRSSANCPASITVGTGYVHGSVELTFPAGNVTCRFPVGSGTVYAPIDLTTPVGSAGGKMTGSTTGNEHPDVANSSIDSSKDVNRFWTLSGDTIGAGSYVATFNFVTGDVDIGANPLGFVLGRYAGAWTAPASPTPSALAITASLAGPIVGATDFVAGEAGFVCSVPAGSPVGTTCVCDNFNRVSLNPSTIYGGSWGVSTNSGSFGAPRIINNRLRLTDNTPSVSTAATSPGTFPARGNWISVEFKHYAYGSNTARTGTISTTAGATAVTGGGTLFTTELANGQHLYTATGVYIGTISSITSNTALALAAGAAATHASIAYGSTGAGADGIALTLSDSTVTAVAGAFGGSLGYAQKCQNGVAGCVNDCNVAGGCPGFTAGWVGIGLDEYGNFSNNTEGRVGVATPPPTAPGLTLDSVGVRGSGSGQIGYPYLGGTGTLTSGIDNATSAAAAPGDAYRLMVDARGYTYHPTLNPGGVRSAWVTVERDTSGTGTSYTPLFTSFDAYVANPSQADVPENWQLSFTGSTGGANNIHEMLGLKICAQTYVPPAGYRIQVDNLSPTTCPSDPQPTVTISPLNTNGQVITTYTNTVTISATLSGGGASSATWVSQVTNQGTWDSVNKRYTFAAGDNGVAKFYLSDLVPQDVYITVTEYTAPGTLTSTLGTPVQFSSGAASFVVSTPAPDTLGDGVVAGRPHLMRITRNKATCGGGTDTTGYEGARALDGWYNPAAGEHPTGANAPQICAPVAGACLPAYGSCQTLSIAPPVVDSGNHNLSLTFLNGVADFCLITSDVGKYSLGLRDDTVATGTPAVTGTSTTLTARPFAVVASNITGGAITPNNPANGGAGGAIFTRAGAAFQASVGAYQWSGTADVDWNGVPDLGATLSQVTGTGQAPSYWWQTALSATLNSPSGGTLGTFGGSLALGVTSNTNPAPVTIPPPCTTPYFFSGIACLSDLAYGEVGSMNLNILPTQNFLNTSGLNLTAANGTVLVFDHSGAKNAVVGRFIPHHFSLAGSVVTRSDLQAAEGQATPFTYMDEPMKLTLTVIAEKLGGGTTENYSDAFAGYSKLDATTLGTGANWFNTGCAGSTQCMGLGAVDGATGLTDRLTIVGSGIYPLVVNPAISWASGIGTVSAHLKLARSALPDGPFETLQLGAMPRDADGVTVLTPDLDAATGNSAPFGNPNASPERRLIANTKVRFGRLWLGNACGSDKRDLTIPFRAEYRNGNNVFISNSDDSLTSIAKANIGLGNHQPAGFDGRVDLTHIPAGPFSVASGLGSFSLGKPPTGLTAAGSVDIVFALGSTTATNTSFDFSTAQPPTLGANMPYLRGKWYGANYDRDPVARAAFGIFCGGSGSRGPIYIRESY